MWLYGGAMIGSLTAITILSDGEERLLVERCSTSSGLRWSASSANHRTPLRTSLPLARPRGRAHARRPPQRGRWEQREANLAELTNARWRRRLVQLAVPVVCLLGYLLWNGSGIHREAVRELILPVTTKDWLVILPYALLVPVLLGRDHIQQRHLERQIKSRSEIVVE